MRMKVEGLKELQASLDQIAKRSTQTAVLRRALAKAAEPMRAKAEALAPVRTGDLSEGIKISTRTVGEVGAAAYSRIMRVTGGDKGASVAAMRDARREARASGINPPVQLFMGPTVGSGAGYGHFQEFGTRNHAPDPFMRPAWESEAKATVDRIAPMLRAEIDRAVARAAKRAAKNGN
jgi:HK97 gp10 family phage protein